MTKRHEITIRGVTDIIVYLFLFRIYIIQRYSPDDIVSVMCVCTSGGAINDRSLYKRIFTDYNPNVRPVRFANQTIEVRLAVTINTLMTMVSEIARHWVGGRHCRPSLQLLQAEI